jgi:hypothetical protein
LSPPGPRQVRVTTLLADFATVWNELFLAERARVVQLLVERVDLQEDTLEGEDQDRGAGEPRG